ncbi:MAG: recombinase family protein, partial [Methylocella sp.]
TASLSSTTPRRTSLSRSTGAISRSSRFTRWGKSLQNRLYRGEIFHKGNAYPGEQPAIVDKPLWDDVQAMLVANRVDRATGARASR